MKDNVNPKAPNSQAFLKVSNKSAGKPGNNFKFRKHSGLFSSLLTTLLLTLCLLPLYPADAAGTWSKPVSLSSQMDSAWFPDISPNSEGGAEVVYSGNDFTSEKDSPSTNKYDRLYYYQIAPDGSAPTIVPSNIAISPFGVVVRNSVAVDSKNGLVHALYRSKGSLFYQNAPLEKSNSALNWSEPRNIDDYSSSYYNDIAVDQKGVIHIVWTQVKQDEGVKGTDVNNFRQVIYYRQSSDFGVSWSFPKLVAVPKYGATRVVLKTDAAGGLHISYDDGYDNYVGKWTATLSGYTHSLDNGKTWSDPTVFGSETEPIVQSTITPFGDSSVMMSWRVIKKQRIDYAISNDRGITWSTPTTIPGSTARYFTAEHFFDRNYLAADGKGRVHFANIGLVDDSRKGKTTGEKAEDLAVDYFIWENGKWSAPQIVTSGVGYPEYPRIAIAPNRVHLVWFVRNKPVDEDAKAIWYSSMPYDTGLAVTPVGKFSPPITNPVTVAVPTVAPTPLAILPPIKNQPTRTWFDDGYKAALFSLGPVAAAAGLMLGVSFWRRRKNKA